VIGTHKGALPEIIKPGETGFLCRSKEEFIEAIRNVDSLSPEACRKDAVTRWNRERVAKEYFEIYKAIVGGEVF